VDVVAERMIPAAGWRRGMNGRLIVVAGRMEGSAARLRGLAARMRRDIGRKRAMPSGCVKENAGGGR
jgi:hypothetical protein